MSIIWLDDVIFDYENGNRTLRSNSVLIYANTLSILFVFIFACFYKSYHQLQKAPKNISFLKIVTEGLISFHLIILLAATNVDHIEELNTVNFFVKLTVSFSPAIVFASFYTCSCMAHNLYLTYYDYSKSYRKRILFYNYSIIFISVIVFIFTIFEVDFNRSITSNDFSLMLYRPKFIIIFYLAGLFLLIYTIHNMYFIFTKESDFVTLTDNPRDIALKTLATGLMKRHMWTLLLYVIIFLPNNLKLIFKHVLNDEVEIFEGFYFNYISIMMISLSGFISVMMQLLDPYFRKILSSYFSKNSEGTQALNEFGFSDNMPLKMEIVEEHEQEEEENDDEEEKKSKKSSLGKHGNYDRNLNATGVYMPPAIELDVIKSNLTANQHHQNHKHNYQHENPYHNQKLIKESKNVSHLSTENLQTPNFGTTKTNDMESIPVLRESLLIGVTINQNFTQNNQIIINNTKRNSHQIFPKNSLNLNSSNHIRRANETHDLLSNIHNFNNQSVKDNIHNENEAYPNSLQNLRYDNFTNIASPLHKLGSHHPTRIKRSSTFEVSKSRNEKQSLTNEGDISFDFMNYHLETTDNIYRMIAISISINQDRRYDKEMHYKAMFKSELPWQQEKFYKESTNCEEYRQENLPDWVNIKNDKNFRKLHLKIEKYCSLVFHHIRVIDKISVDDCINSLNPILNLEKIDECKVSGGRSPNSILYTWDRRMLIKTISEQEKDLLIDKLLKNYHVRMRDTKSLLCRIYGLFRISISDQFSTYVVLMKNMCELPLQTKILTFDIKGSSVDRDCISNSDKKKYLDLTNKNEFKAREYKEEIIKLNKDNVLKDNDLRFLELEFNLSSSNAINLKKAVEKDSEFLEKYEITDYSLLFALHYFNKDDYRRNFKNLGVLKSSDNKYLFCFSIIDFLTTYDLAKKSEKLTKQFVNIIKNDNDTNFSVQNPNRYKLRFRNFINSLIKIEDN